MRTRAIKKHYKKHKGDRTYGSWLRQGHSKGSKKLRRRSKASHRLSRAARRESARNYEMRGKLIEEMDAHDPKDEKERQCISAMRSRLVALREKQEIRLACEKEMEQALTGARQFNRLLRVATATGRWPATSG